MAENPAQPVRPAQIANDIGIATVSKPPVNPLSSDVCDQPQDYDELYTDGALAIFGPGTVIPIAALKVLEILERRRTVQSSRHDGSPESSLPAMASS
jgi:hypothetical protein